MNQRPSWLPGRSKSPAQRTDTVGIWLAAAAFTPAALLSILFPEGGSQPFATGAFLAIVLSCGLLLWLLPRDQRLLRAGVLLYLGSTVVAFAVASPMGGNASRLGVAFAGPLLLCAALPAATSINRRRFVLAAVIPLLLWQWWAPVRETIKGADDPSSHRAYFRPLLTFLADRADAAPVRVEVPFTRLHWEAVHVARSTSLARGWETQLDVKYNALFRVGAEKKLTAATYKAWLGHEGVHYVALPDVALDPTGRAEAKLIRGGLPFLRRVFKDRHWEVFEVLHTPGLDERRRSADAPWARRPSRCTPVIRATRSCGCATRRTGACRAETGCVWKGSGGWTVIQSMQPGNITIEASFDPRRILESGPNCSSVKSGV